jgi:hypothetical protein
MKLITLFHACRYHLGVDLISHSEEAGESLLRMFWDHQDSVLCCSFKVTISFILLHLSKLVGLISGCTRKSEMLDMPRVSLGYM